MTQAEFDQLPRLDRTPVPYHWRLRGGGVSEEHTDYVLNSSATEVGVVVGGGDLCQLEGCGGAKLSVRWPDGRLTRPCTKGLVDVPGLPDVQRIG